MSAPSTPLAVAPLQVDVPKSSLLGMLAWGGVIAVLAASWQGADMRPLDLVRDSGNMAKYAADFFPPNFSQWQFYLQEMLVTLQIAVWGTALAVVFAIPLGPAVLGQHRTGLGAPARQAHDGRGARHQ